MPTLQDDLMTELLNNDKKYIAQRKAHFNLFKNQIKPNLDQEKSNLNWLNIFYKNLFPTVVIGTLGAGLIIFVSLQSFINKPASQNLNKESGQNQLVGGNLLNNNSNAKTITQSNTNGANRVSDSNKQLTNSVQETPIAGSLGEYIKFSYNSSTKILKYNGHVIGRDGCSSLKEIKLENDKDKFVLKYSIVKAGEICTQVISQIPVKGEINIELSPKQLENFSAIFSISLV